MTKEQETIERCEQLIKPEHANWLGISNQLSIAHLIKRIKDLEEENRIYVLNGNNVKLEIYIKDNYIPKQKIKENYLKMEKEYERKVYDNNYNRTEVKKEEFYKRQVYEELLEDK